MQVEDLDVFKLSHELTQQIYGLTKDFPENEKYGLMSQMRRAAYSVPMNLMEGGHRIGKNEFNEYFSTNASTSESNVSMDLFDDGGIGIIYTVINLGEGEKERENWGA